MGDADVVTLLQLLCSHFLVNLFVLQNTVGISSGTSERIGQNSVHGERANLEITALNII